MCFGEKILIGRKLVFNLATQVGIEKYSKLSSARLKIYHVLKYMVVFNNFQKILLFSC